MTRLRQEHVDYGLLDKAKKYYSSKGYHYLETPWVIPPEIAAITSPGLEFNFNTTEQEILTASAEQSFLSMLNNPRYWLLSDKRYQSITPCFRRDKEDESHSLWFMKLELFKWYDVDTRNSRFLPNHLVNEAYSFINDAMKFFRRHTLSYLWRSEDLMTIPQPGQTCYDINYNGVEIGSYGIRSHNNYTWVYGTGLALPRFSYARKQLM